MTAPRYQCRQSRRELGLRIFHLALASQRALPEPLPAPLRGASDVRVVEAHRARAALPRLPAAGELVSGSARLRHPAPGAPRFQRHGSRSAYAVAALQRPVDDVADEEAVFGLRAPPPGTGAPVRRRGSGVAVAPPPRRLLAAAPPPPGDVFPLLPRAFHPPVADPPPALLLLRAW